jgi:hypothetical protein
MGVRVVCRIGVVEVARPLRQPVVGLVHWSTLRVCE